MMTSLKHKTAGALLWNLLDRAGQQILLFVVGILVANILTVDDYALVGMLSLFVALSTILLDSGFSVALIQRKEVSQQEYSTVFWFNMGISVLLYVLLTACSPLIAHFFNQPLLVPLSFVIFLALPINALTLVQSVLLNREIRFAKLTRINLLSMTISGISSLVMALLGCGVWTLAWQVVILATTRAILFWVRTDWHPHRIFHLSVIRSLFGYASCLMFASIINTGFLNIFSFIIGKFFPIRQLGYYTQGNKMCDMGVSLLYSSIQNATLPILSSIQDNRKRLLRAYRKTMRFTALVAFPVMVGLYAVSRPVVELLLKEEWWPTIPFLQYLSLGGLFTILTAINNNFIKISGHTRGILHIEFYKVILTVVVISCTFNRDALTLVKALVLIKLMIYLINTFYTQRHTGYTILKQLQDIVPYALLAAIMGLSLHCISIFVHNNLLLIVIQIVVGAMIYIGLCYLTGSTILKEAIGLIKKKK